ncbi:MAG TPA: hypothetical protein VHC18_06635 [Amycolatopsis sp.]|nr:hypothetical protein [Amycolatopsis sp.]
MGEDATPEQVQAAWDAYDRALITYHWDTSITMDPDWLQGSREHLDGARGKLQGLGCEPDPAEDLAVIKAGVGVYPYPPAEQFRPLRPRGRGAHAGHHHTAEHRRG